MSALLLLLFFGFHHGPVCPPLQPETTPIFESFEEARIKHPKLLINEIGAVEIKKKGATTTFLYIGSTTMYMNFATGEVYTNVIKVGDKPNPEAIAYNKRVRECKTANGEF